MRISDWSSDVCSSDLFPSHDKGLPQEGAGGGIFGGGGRGARFCATGQPAGGDAGVGEVSAPPCWERFTERGAGLDGGEGASVDPRRGFVALI